MKKSIICFAQKQEKELLSKYPRMEEEIPRMFAVRKDGSDDWPDWCYLPMAASYAIVTRGAEELIAKRMMGVSKLEDFHIMSAIIPWRVGRPVYRFDTALAAELMDHDADEDNIPADVLKTLPYPCICIERPLGLPDCECLYAFLEYDYRYSETVELRMHYAYADKMFGLFLQWTSDRQTLNAQMYDNAVRDMRHIQPEDQYDPRYGMCLKMLRKHVNLVLYLCSEQPEVTRSAPIPRVRGADNRQKTAAYPDMIDVGTYVGAAIRSERVRDSADHDASVTAGSPKRPHVRRAHWHLYWTGEGRKTPRVKWIMPIVVHSEHQTQAATIHPVKE